MQIHRDAQCKHFIPNDERLSDVQSSRDPRDEYNIIESQSAAHTPVCDALHQQVGCCLSSELLPACMQSGQCVQQLKEALATERNLKAEAQHKCNALMLHEADLAAAALQAQDLVCQAWTRADQVMSIARKEAQRCGLFGLGGPNEMQSLVLLHDALNKPFIRTV